MLRTQVLTILIGIITFEYAKGQKQWCYECNTNLREGHQAECNDPYVPGPSMDLVACPQNEPYHCLKSVIFYRNILVTVRGCVPSRKIEGYCQHEDSYPESNVECYFCNEYGCNGQESLKLLSPWILNLLMIILIFFLQVFM